MRPPILDNPERKANLTEDAVAWLTITWGVAVSQAADDIKKGHTVTHEEGAERWAKELGIAENLFEMFVDPWLNYGWEQVLVDEAKVEAKT
jgi:hypothetical protein